MSGSSENTPVSTSFSSWLSPVKILAKLTELGFYGNSNSSTTTTKPKITKQLKYLKDIIAGSICIGPYSSMALSDYGPTQHTLPTIGSAKFSSGLCVNDFLKRHSLIKITKTGIERLGPSVINLAQHENLEGHANSIKIRLKKEN